MGVSQHVTRAILTTLAICQRRHAGVVRHCQQAALQFKYMLFLRPFIFIKEFTGSE